MSETTYLHEEYSQTISTLFDVVVERELTNFFQINCGGIPPIKEIKNFGERLLYPKDPLALEFKWKKKSVLRFKGSMDVLQSILKIGVERVYLNAIEPNYYQFKINTDGVELL